MFRDFLRGIEQVRVMTLRDVGMRAQARFQIVAARLAKQRIARVLRQPARLRGEFRRERENRHMRVVIGPEKESDGEPVGARRRRDDAMDIGAQIAIGGELQNLADIDDEGSGDRRRVDPAALALDLQPAWFSCNSRVRNPESLWAPTP